MPVCSDDRRDAVAEGRRPARLRDQSVAQRHCQRQRPDGRRPGRRLRALAIAIGNVAENIIGTPRADTLIGTNNGETINGLAGNDRIFGNGGNDRIIGGLGADCMTGGAGNDVFVFNSISDSAPGQSGYVNNGSFSCAGRPWASRHHHRLHARARTGSTCRRSTPTPGLAATRLSPGSATATSRSAPGQLIERIYNPAGTANDKTIIYGDINGDARADFQIELTGLKTLTASDFIL